LSERGTEVLHFGREAKNGLYALSSDGLNEALQRHGVPRRVFHLAGGATVGRSMRDPHADYLSNVATTELVLEILRPLSPIPFVLASSAAVYGVGHDDAILCDATLRPGSPYGHHKLMAEMLARGHAQAFGTPLTICRLFSIYGAGLRKQLIYDSCLRLARLEATDTLELGGTGAERRDWLHVSDAVQGLADLIDPAPGNVRLYNLASGAPTTIRDVANKLIDVWGESHSLAFSGETRIGDPFSLYGDPASQPPGFTPRIILRDGLADMVEWFRGTEI
jgi:UDP-glucose 4-epimerase